MNYEKILYPEISRFRFNYRLFLEISVHEGSVYQALLRDHYRIGSSSTIRNALRKMSEIGLFRKPRFLPSRRGRRIISYQLTPKGLLMAMFNPEVQSKSEVAGFFRKTVKSRNALMNTLRIINWLTHPKQKKSLLVDLVGGFARLGWNLQYTSERELNKRILLLWAIAFSIQGEEKALHKNAQTIGHPMTHLEVAAQLSTKMRLREEFLEDRQAGEPRPDFITKWRLNSASFVDKYYNIQELLRHRFKRASQLIPKRYSVRETPEREEILTAQKPLETLVCYQQGELKLHLDYVWPEIVLNILSSFLEGKHNLSFSTPLSIECLAKDNSACIREGDRAKCILTENERTTKCPYLNRRMRELHRKLEKQLSHLPTTEEISSENQRLNWKEDRKKGTLHFHTDIVPFSR